MFLQHRNAKTVTAHNLVIIMILFMRYTINRSL